MIRIARVTFKGGLNLFIGQLLTTIISAIGAIAVMRLLTPSEYGVVTVALIAPTILSLLAGLGMGPALARHIAWFRERGREGIEVITLISFLLQIAMSALLTILSWFSAGVFASHIFHRPGIAYLIGVASLFILGNGLYNSSYYLFQGFEKMEYSSIIMILQALIRAVSGPVLIILGLGALGAVWGVTLGALGAGLMGLILTLSIFRGRTRNFSGDLSFLKGFKLLFSYGVPLTLVALLGNYTVKFGLISQLSNLYLSWFTTNEEIGNFAVATTLVMAMLLFTFPIETVIFPAFSKIDPSKENREMNILFRYSVKYSSLLVIPTSMALMVLSRPLIYGLFGSKYSLAPDYLSLYASIFLLAGIGSLTAPHLLNGIGRTWQRMILSLITFILSLVLCPPLTLLYRVPGLIIGMIIATASGHLYALYWLKRNYGVGIDYNSILRIYLSSILAASATYLLTSALNIRPQL